MGGIARVYSLSQELKKKYTINILAIRDEYHGYFGLKKNLTGVNVKFINTNRKINHKALILKKIFKILFRNILYILSIDAITPHISKLSEESISIIDKNKISIVIISGPPFSLFRLVKKLVSKYPEIKIILDYRDGWTTRISSKYLSIFNFLIFNYFEKNYLNHSKLVTLATNTIKDDLDKKIKINSQLITNGYMSKFNLKNLSNSKEDNCINIGYFGLISDSRFSYRNIGVFYESIDKKSNINFHFYGNSEIKNKKYLDFNRFNFKKNVDFINVSTEMKKMDYLLIFHSEKSTVREVITGKFYEYVTTGIPILVVTNGVSEVSKIVKKYNLGLSIDYSKENLKFFFKRKLKKRYVINRDKFIINSFSRDFQNKLFIKNLDAIC